MPIKRIVEYGTQGKICCGDVLEMMEKIPSASIHLAITSPPYNVGKHYDKHNDRMTYKNYLKSPIRLS